MGQKQGFIRDVLFECPVCSYRMVYQNTYLSKMGKVHQWVCMNARTSFACKGILVMSRDRALLAKDLSSFGRWVLNSGKVEQQLVRTKRGRIEREKSFTKLVRYMESNPDELIAMRAEYLGNRL